MREVFADFAQLEERPELGLSVPLGPEDLNPELAALGENETVTLVEPGNLAARGKVVCIEEGGRRWWYGIVAGKIHDIHPAARQ